MSQSKDKRSSPRRAFSQPVTFEISATRAGQPADCLERRGLAIDLSRHGLGLETDCRLAEGELIKLLSAGPDPEHWLPPLARVQWVTAIGGDRCRVGLHFLGFAAGTA